jgi:hypothetical protein
MRTQRPDVSYAVDGGHHEVTTEVQASQRLTCVGLGSRLVLMSAMASITNVNRKALPSGILMLKSK